MIFKEFEFHAPRQLADALSLLDRHADDAKVLSGGMSLMPAMNLGLVQPEVVISLNHIPALDYVQEEGDVIRIGALTRHERVSLDPLIRRSCPLLSEAAAAIGDVQIRHRGTIGGGVAHADPGANYLPVMVALGARLVARSVRGARTIPAQDFFVDIMQTSLEPGELVVEIQVPKLDPASSSAYLHFSRIEGAFPIVNAAAIVGPGLRSVRLAVGGAGPRPVLVEDGGPLRGGLTDQAIQALGQAVYDACHEAYGDLNGDADYHRAMARVFAQRALKAASGGMREA